MSTLHDHLWLWGQSPNGHWNANPEKKNGNHYSLPMPSRMTAMEGCSYFRIPNCCRVRIQGHPQPPYDQESMAMDTLDQVVWSLLGAGGEQATEWGDLEEVIRQARMFPNITGGVFDDFVSPIRLSTYTPEKLHTMKEKLCREAGRPLDMWVVYYERDMYNPELSIDEYLNEFDVISFWTWYGQNLKDVKANLDRVIERFPEKRIMAGCYMWDYGNSQPLSQDLMEYQCEVYLDYLKQGKIDGIVVCSNCIADMNIPQVAWMRKWILEHQDIVID